MSRNIFEKRVNLKPYEYPELLNYVDSIRHSYWIHTEFNFTSDIQDYKTNLTESERESLKRALLAISQIEVSVKTFWWEIHKVLPKPEISSVGFSFAECHKEGTEILTPRGWVDFRDIKKWDEVAQWDNWVIYFSEALEKTEDFFEWELININKKTLNASVTPNHRIIYKNSNWILSEKRVKDLSFSNSDNKLPETWMLVWVEDKLSILDKLSIAIQADGSQRFNRLRSWERVNRWVKSWTNTYEISIKKDRKKERLKDLIEKTGYTYREFSVWRRGYIKYEIDIPLEDRQNLKNFEWIDLSNKSGVWCEEFIQELAEWDWYRLEDKKDCKIKYSTTNKKNADIVQSIWVCAWYRAHLWTYVDNRSETYKDVYTIWFTSNREFTSFSSLKTTKEKYSWKVYCVTVPSGVIITRYNNTTFISGNSEVRHQDAYSHLLEILWLNEEFRKIWEIPAIQDRIDYLDKIKEDNDIVSSILLFSLFVEHISLFSQFLIIMAFNKHKNIFKWISNVVEATSKEEQIHWMFWIDIINIIQKENPNFFTEDKVDKIYTLVDKAYKAECKILDWIFEEWELDFLPSMQIKEFIKDRFNSSLTSVWFNPRFEVDEQMLEKTEWFDDEILASKHWDFFVKRSVNYNKKSQSITEDDLF